MARSGGLMADFKNFIMQGNVVDLAVAVIIAGAFGKIIESFVADIITPAILSPVLSTLKLDDLAKLSYNGIKYGSFLAAVINFLVIAFSIFVMVRAIEKAKNIRKREEAAGIAPPDPQERLTTAMERLADAMDRR
jgi:large conductance mechanosensitive channel